MERLYESIFPREMSLTRELCATAVVFSGAFLLTYYLLKFLSKKKDAGNFPPGLPSVPLLGSLPFLPPRDLMHIFFTEKARELGPVFTLNFPNRLAVVVNGRDMIHEAFVKQSLIFASRPNSFSNELLNPELKGILYRQYDSAFRRYHQLSLNILKKLGFGRGIMENRIHVEVADLLANIRKLNGKAFCADQLLSRSVSNVIISIILGERYDHSSPMLAELIEKIHEYVCMSKDRMIVDFLPIMRFLPKYSRSFRHISKLHAEILQIMGSKIDAGQQGELRESFITHFLEMEGPEFDRDQLLFSLRDLFVAGSETTASTLQWALILLANHPDIQQKLQTEIDSVVSKGTLPSLDDKKKLPFAEAVILELMRIKTIVPLNLLHETLDDTHLNGYFIPKGSMIMANLYSSNMDPTVWKDPNTFNPERFIAADGKVINKEAIASFSMGRRSCLGELLAHQELFLFLTGLVQHFEILPPEGQSAVVYKAFTGVTMVPTDYQVRLLPRCN